MARSMASMIVSEMIKAENQKKENYLELKKRDKENILNCKI